MNKIKSMLLLVLRLVLVVVAMLVAFIISASVIRTGVDVPPEDASQAGLALLIVSLINSLVLAYLILRSRWTGWKLIAVIFVVYFGIESVMTQIETLYFNNSINMPLDIVIRVIATGLARALVFAPLAVFILGKLKGTATAEAFPPMPMPEWVKRIALLAVVYTIVYFMFGYFVAWQWAEVRQFYTGSTAMQPFLTHMANTLSGDPILPLFQILRGALWAGLALLMVKMTKGKTLETCLALAMTLAVILASGVIFPNPFMPPLVRQGHFFELSSSMFTFGLIAGWVWTRPTQGAKASDALHANAN